MGNELVMVREPDTNALGNMLRFRRPEGSRTERYFIKRFLTPLGVQMDKRGNLIKAIGDNPSVMWSSHTDTVHREGGADQTMLYTNGVITLSSGSKSNCLGADDTAGVWLMREMILCNIPGLYVFHRGEEKGGIGSRFIADKTPALLSNIKHAIALDRKGTDSVITFQWSGRCCSDEFAKELGKRLGEYKTDAGGSFTDTANYMRLVPECTNLSVGYRWEHSKNEELNVVHLLKLRKALIGLNTDGLPVKRDPAKHESRSYGGGYWDEGWEGYGHWGRGTSTTTTKPQHSAVRQWVKPVVKPVTGWCKDCYRGRQWCKCESIETTVATENVFEIPYDPRETIRRNPDSVIKMMLAYGWNESEIIDDLYKYGAALVSVKG